MVIAVVSSKGGTGKSTITLNLASMLSSNKQSVLVIDADPQGSIAHWSKIRKQDEPAVHVQPSPVYRKKVKKSSKKYDIILFDSPPLLATTEAQAISQTVGQIAIVIAENMTPCDDVRAALNLLDKNKPVNAILNMSRRPIIGGYNYGGYGYGQHAEGDGSGSDDAHD